MEIEVMHISTHLHHAGLGINVRVVHAIGIKHLAIQISLIWPCLQYAVCATPQWWNHGRDLNCDCLGKCRPIYIGFLGGNSSGNTIEPWIQSLCTRSGSISPWQAACTLWKDLLLLLQSILSDLTLCSLLKRQNLALIQPECNYSPAFSVNFNACYFLSSLWQQKKKARSLWQH